MYHFPSKRRQIIMRIIVSISMSAAVLLLVGFLVFYMLGYHFDRSEGRIEQNGLVQYVTTPNRATVEVDGATLSSKTPTKSSVVPGAHEFVMWRDGYETWRKTETINAGTLTWLNYTRLVPKDRPLETVAQLPKAAASLASPEGRFMAILGDSAQPTIDFYDLESDTVKKANVTLSSDDYTDAKTKGVTHHFSFVEWDQSGRYLLLKHRYNKAVEWLVVDRQAGSLENNITKTMDINMSEVHFSGTSGSEFFALSNHDLRKINLSNETLSRPLASNVSEFSLYGTNTISFVTAYDKTTKQRQVGLVRDSDKQPIIIRTSTSAPTVPLHVAATRYFNKDYVVIAEGKKVSILGGIFPTSSDEVDTRLTPFGSFDFTSDIKWLQVSGIGRFIVAQTGAKYVSYDLEWKKLSPVATLAGSGTATELRWLDDYYLWSDRSGSLAMREFDGANEHAINTVATGFDASLNPDGTYLYSIGKSQTGFQLQRVKMILN